MASLNFLFLKHLISPFKIFNSVSNRYLPSSNSVITIDASIVNLVKSQVNCIDSTASIPSMFNINECPSASFYMPSFLNLENSFYNGFPVMQEIACYGSKIILNCPQKHFIHLLSAYYGIQAKTVIYSIFILKKKRILS